MTDPQIQSATLAVIVALVGLFTVLVRVVGPIVDARAQTWAATKAAILTSHLPPHWNNLLQQAAIFGAQAAEQLAIAQKLSNAADAKKQYAIQAAEHYLDQQGFHVDLSLLGDAIEQVILQGLHLPPPTEQKP